MVHLEVDDCCDFHIALVRLLSVRCRLTAFGVASLPGTDASLVPHHFFAGGRLALVDQNVQVREQLDFAVAAQVRGGRPELGVVNSDLSVRNGRLKVVSVHGRVHFAF